MSRRIRLFRAIGDGDLQVTRELLEGEEDMDTIRDDDYEAPLLHRACWYGKLQIAKYLIQEMKANVNSIDKFGQTALYRSLGSFVDTDMKIKIAELLLTNGADVNVKVSSPSDDTALHRACLSDSTDLVQVLLKHGANVNSRDSNGRTPLYDACIRYPYTPCTNDVIKLLLANNGDRHIKTRSSGKGPLDELRRRGHEEVLESYDKWPLAVSGVVVNNAREATLYKQSAVRLNPRLSQHQHTLGTKALLLVQKLPVHEVAYGILGFLSPAAVEKLFLPTAEVSTECPGR